MSSIIAMGGGGFSMEPDNPALDRYVVAQTGKARPKVCFVPTASGDAELYVLHFYQAFTELECIPSSLSLFRPPTGDLEDFVMEKDAIYVGGGNTRNMLALWKEWGLDSILKRAHAAGVVLAGISAGANCWFESFTTDSMPGQISVLPGLGILPGSFTPHYDGEAERRPALHRLLLEGRIQPGLASDNSSAVHYQDGALARCISSRREAPVYRVTLAKGEVVEEKLPLTFVGPA